MRPKSLDWTSGSIELSASSATKAELLHCSTTGLAKVGLLSDTISELLDSVRVVAGISPVGIS